MAKLTLSMDKQTIDRAKKLAVESDTSVSAMFVRFIQALTARKSKTPRTGPLTRKATGSIALGGKDYKEVLTDALSEKYGLGR
ncbi:MAG: hypothetical protein J7M40_12605 [Planctomycetes bacterium]|nr:hypothetical protein [Planctomycetota bacterium]